MKAIYLRTSTEEQNVKNFWLVKIFNWIRRKLIRYSFNIKSSFSIKKLKFNEGFKQNKNFSHTQKG